MAFGRHTSLVARGEGPPHRRQLLVENIGPHTAVAITVTVDGPWGANRQLSQDGLDRLEAGHVLPIPLPQMRPGDAHKVSVRWTAERGLAGEFFGVVTAGR